MSSTPIGADQLFPRIVYCLNQSECNYWNRWFMIRNFYAKQILSFGHTGFCFSIINAVIAPDSIM